jgi:hypothetical protein
MFGLFGKKEAPNSSFNNFLVASIGEIARKGGQLPSEESFLNSVEKLASGQGMRLSPQQINSVRLCRMLLEMGVGEEILQLARKMIAEIPKGNVQSADALKNLLTSHAVIVGDEALEFFNNFLGRRG